MKLKCELRPLRNGGHSLGFNDGDREHDAAAAHALMIALERWASRRADNASYAEFLIGHADELMSQWGLDTGEDA